MKAQSLLLDGTNHKTSNLNMYGHSIENLKTPTTNRHAVNKEYVDNNYIPKNREINMTGNNIINLANGTNSQDAINKGQLDNAIATIHTKGKDIDLQDKYSVIDMKNYSYPIHGNLDKATSYANMREIFFSKKEGGTMKQSINMNNHEIFNVKDPTAADQVANKKHVDTQLATKLDKADAKKYVNVDGSNGMTGNLDLNDKKIINLNTDDKDIKSAANVGYVSSKVYTAKGDVTVGLKTYFDTKIKESHITSSTNKKDVFRYLMENADESSSENNIIVDC